MSGSSGLNGRSGSRKKNSSKASSQNQSFSSGNGIDVAKEADFSPAQTKPLATLRGRSAHITLGSAYGFGARETNFDVLRLCDMEAGRPAVAGDFMPVTGGMARYFGDGVCCVYFYQPLLVHTIFSGFY
ncbi:hypothetical protein BaRGS_00017879 [Batillaria attramentaria]|uniref:Cyclic nucleotide phosphodiesterase catalytic domain-containing protein n=1 Tax=Batillaria attramentaria TaxID=370345 RepID=A0ABD0KU69_9CAEN